MPIAASAGSSVGTGPHCRGLFRTVLCGCASRESAPFSGSKLLWSSPCRQMLVNSQPDTIGQSEYDGLTLPRGLRNAAQFRIRLDVVAEHGDRSQKLDAPIARGARQNLESLALPLGPQCFVGLPRLESVVDIVEQECRVGREAGKVRIAPVVRKIVDDAIRRSQSIRLCARVSWSQTCVRQTCVGHAAVGHATVRRAAVRHADVPTRRAATRAAVEP